MKKQLITNASDISLEVMKAWENLPLIKKAWELAEKRPWEYESTDWKKNVHVQDSLGCLAQSSFAMGFHKGKAIGEQLLINENAKLKAILSRTILHLDTLTKEITSKL